MYVTGNARKLYVHVTKATNEHGSVAETRADEQSLIQENLTTTPTFTVWTLYGHHTHGLCRVYNNCSVIHGDCVVFTITAAHKRDVTEVP